MVFKYPSKAFLITITLIILNGFNIALAQVPVQPPHFSYNNPNTYTVSTPITPLAPTSTGGTVPATIFGDVSTFAGKDNTVGYNDATGNNALFTSLWGIDIDASGNLYVSDNTRIRKITPGAVVTTFAGGNPNGVSDGNGAAAGFGLVTGLSVAPSGNIFVGDAVNKTIRQITPAGTVTTFAGSGLFNFNPAGVTTDQSGNIFVADQVNDIIRKFTTAGSPSIYAGSQGSPGLTNGPIASSVFNNPADLKFDISGNMFVADESNNMIREISAAGIVTTVAGNTNPGLVNGPDASALFIKPSALALDPVNNIYVTDAKGLVIRMIEARGVVISLAGDNVHQFSTDGIGSAASFAQAAGLVYSNGALYVADQTCVRKIIVTGYSIDKALPVGLTFDATTGVISGTPVVASPATEYTITAYNAGGSYSTTITITVTAAIIAAPIISYQTPQVYTVNKIITPLKPTNTGGAVPASISGQISTFAGSGAQGKADGTGASATFNQPGGLAIDAAGNIYVADVSNFSIRKITPAGVVTTVANYSGGAFGLAVDAAGNVYVADEGNNQIEKISPAGVITIIAGGRTPGSANGTGLGASFNTPIGIAVDAAGNLYVADELNNLIRKITPAGVVTTFAGSGATGETDGAGIAAAFNRPIGIAVDPNGNVYVADYGGNKIRKITPGGIVTTLAGSGANGTADGTGAQASFFEPEGIAIDKSGSLYIADTGNDLIRKINPAGQVITVAGDVPGATDPNKNFHQPLGIVLDASGNVYVSEFGGNIISEVIVAGYSINKSLPPGLTFDSQTGTISGTPTAVSPATDYTVTAYNAGGSNSTIVNITVIANIPTPQTITFGPLPVKTYGDPDFLPGATSSNNTLPITYTSDNTGVATIINSQIHITGAGTTNITASQDGNDSYAAATPVTQLLTVNKAPLTLTADDKTKIVGQVNPILTFSHTPFAYTEDVSVLTTQPVLSTIATTNSAVGQYVISIVDATSPNYDITQLAGKLTINPAPESIVVPNAFTPNGDGINDLWNIKSLTDFPQCTVSVYARNGSLIFQSRGYGKPWDGTYNGSPVPTGTYYYIIIPQSGLQKLSGSVTVLR